MNLTRAPNATNNDRITGFSGPNKSKNKRKTLNDGKSKMQKGKSWTKNVSLADRQSVDVVRGKIL